MTHTQGKWLIDPLVVDDKFVKSQEFRAFLYKQKGKSIRESVGNITPNNEDQLLNNLRLSVENKMKDMTPERERKLLELGVMIFLGLDLNYALAFATSCKITMLHTSLALKELQRCTQDQGIILMKVPS